MSKIGRMPIDTKGISIEIKGNEIHYKGPKATGVYTFPDVLKVEHKDDKIFITCEDRTQRNRELWGLHRALVANTIKGSREGFEQDIVITGLGYKGQLQGDKIIFSLGKSHKIDFELPNDINVEIDKSGQKLKVKGVSKERVGFVSSKIKALRPPEPYKGTGIKLAGEEIRRKAGKKSA